MNRWLLWEIIINNKKYYLHVSSLFLCLCDFFLCGLFSPVCTLLILSVTVFFSKKKEKLNFLNNNEKKHRKRRSVKINLTPLILWSQRIFANRSLPHFCRWCKTMTNHLRGEKRKTISCFCTFKHPWTLLICFVVWILTLHFAKTGAGMRWWMIETPPPRPSRRPPPPFSFLYMTATLSPPTDTGCVSSFFCWCSDGMAAESALRERRTRQKTEQPSRFATIDWFK